MVSSEVSRSPNSEKARDDQLDVVHTNERVPGHPGYYEKEGLGTYDEGEDHVHEPPVSFRSRLLKYFRI